MTTLSDLSVDLVGEIYSRVPLISLSEVRCTCTTWNTLSWNVLSENYVFGKADTSKQFLGFVVMNSKVCSLGLDLQGIHNNDFVDPSLKEINIVDQYDISNIFHCDGLLLCVRWIQPRSKYHKFHRLDMKFLDDDEYNKSSKINFPSKFEIYYFNTDSWRVLNVNPDCDLERDVSLKGHTYYYARQKEVGEPVSNRIGFLLCFDFTSERVGPRLPLPFHSSDEETVTLSCIREEQLALLYQPYDLCLDLYHAWTMFFTMERTSLSDFSSNFLVESFFIDEEKKVAVVSKSRKYRPNENCGYETVNIIGQIYCENRNRSYLET
ncbi:putative F-box domain-containing protein [Arabidopsis thaliana]